MPRRTWRRLDWAIAKAGLAFIVVFVLVAWCEAVADDRVRVLGHDHPDVLNSRQHLAVAYRSAGQPEKAVALLVALVADTKRVLGPYHPHTLSAQQHVARAYVALDGFGGAGCPGSLTERWARLAGDVVAARDRYVRFLIPVTAFVVPAGFP